MCSVCLFLNRQISAFLILMWLIFYFQYDKVKDLEYKVLHGVEDGLKVHFNHVMTVISQIDYY